MFTVKKKYTSPGTRTIVFGNGTVVKRVAHGTKEQSDPDYFIRLLGKPEDKLPALASNPFWQLWNDMGVAIEQGR